MTDLRWDLVIRKRDGKMQARDRQGKPLTGWFKDFWRLWERMSRRDPKI